MFCNKKSQSWSTLGKIILILLVAVVILLVVEPILKGGEKGSDIAACKNWAVLQSAVKDPVFGVRLAELKNPCVTFQDKAKGDEEEVYDIIASGMYDVWNMYGQGKVDFFSDKILNPLKTGSNLYCFIGNEISFDKNIELESLKIDVLEEFLSSNYPPNSEVTYAEFFTGAKESTIDFGESNIEINPSEKMYVIFAIEKKTDFSAKKISTDLLQSVGTIVIGTNLVTKGKLSPIKLEKVGKGKLGLDELIIKPGSTVYGPATPDLEYGNIIPGKKIITPAKTKKIFRLPGKVAPVLSKASVITLGVMITASTAYDVLSDQSLAYPSLMVVKGEDIVKNGCNSPIYYNPKTQTSRFNEDE